jgi:hypothetical protein
VQAFYLLVFAAPAIPAGIDNSYRGADLGVTVGSGFTNPITITFREAIDNFYLDVLNGELGSVDYVSPTTWGTALHSWRGR